MRLVDVDISLRRKRRCSISWCIWIRIRKHSTYYTIFYLQSHLSLDEESYNERKTDNKHQCTKLCTGNTYLTRTNATNTNYNLLQLGLNANRHGKSKIRIIWRFFSENYTPLMHHHAKHMQKVALFVVNF